MTQHEKDEAAAEEYAMNRPSSDCSESLHLGCLEKEAFLKGISHARAHDAECGATTFLNNQILELRAQRAALTARCEKLEKAAKSLRGNVKGILSVHELAIRHDFGNSNWECLQISIRMVDEAIEAVEK